MQIRALPTLVRCTAALSLAALVWTLPAPSVAAQCVEPPANLAAWWPLDEATGTSGVWDVAAHVPARLFGNRGAEPGRVRSALVFDGNGDFALSGDQPLLDFGPGQDFSIDFWIRKPVSDSALEVILEKRDFSGSPIGWQIFMFGGTPGLQLATGSGPASCSDDPTDACTNMSAPFNVADGEWHFVAVTVDRDHAAGVQWYLDGLPVGPGQNPTVRQGSLASSVGTQIGAGRSSGNEVFAPFTGSLDEIEVFRRELTPQEVWDLYQAGAAGKCPYDLQVPWDTSTGCINLPATADLEICNRLGHAESFQLDFAGLPAGSQVHPVYPCSAAGPTTFELVDPTQPEILVGARSCRTVKVKAGGVPAPQPFQIACYSVTATPESGGEALVGFGSLYLTGPICCDRGSTVTEVPRGETATATFRAENLTDEPQTFQFQFEVVDSDMQPAEGAVVLGEPEPPGEVEIPPRGIVDIEVPVTLAEFERFRPYEVLLLDSSRPAPNALVSQTVRSAATGDCLADETTLCLNDGRFEVTVAWQDFQGNVGVGHAEPLTSDTGYFWFFRDTNVELVIKALDGRAVNQHWWIFYGALSNVEYTIQVRDTVSGAVRTYTNPAGQFASVGDTEAFPASGAPAFSAATVDELAAGPMHLAATAFPELAGDGLGVLRAALGTCAPDAGSLCLQDNRFRVEVEWEDFQGNTGSGTAVPLTSDTGYFWFFRDTNVELIVKILDGRPVNGSWWVFYGSLSNVGYQIIVSDTERNRTLTLANPRGTFASRGETTLLPAP